MNLRHRLIAICEGLCLLGIAGFILHLVLSRAYWEYLNPKYMPLSLTAAAVLALLGLTSACARHGRRTYSRPIIYILFLSLCLFSGFQRLEIQTKPKLDDIQYRLLTAPPPLDPSAADDSDTVPVSDDPAPNSTATLNGKTYTPINVGEIFGVCQNATTTPTQNFVLRGMAVQSPALAKLNEFAIVRAAVYCCLADAIGVGIRCQGPFPQGLADGSWVRVYGSLTPSVLPKNSETMRRKGLFVTSLQKNYALIPDHIEPIAMPQDPFMFEWHDNAPYAY